MSSSGEHYVDNKAFLAALREYRSACRKSKQTNRRMPPVPEFIGECFLRIATHLSYRPNFINYTFREDMISDGVENCLMYMHNFNPRKSKNPFGYFTSVIYYAFVRRIQRERKHTYLKYRLMEDAIISGDTHTSPDGSGHFRVDTEMLSYENVQDFIQRFDEYHDKRRERRREMKQKTSKKKTRKHKTALE